MTEENKLVNLVKINTSYEKIFFFVSKYQKNLLRNYYFSMTAYKRPEKRLKIKGFKGFLL